MLPANGPTPPITATITPSQGGITRRFTAARQSSDITIQPMPCTQPSTDTTPSRSVIAAHSRIV